jgi:hypothetical protein
LIPPEGQYSSITNEDNVGEIAIPATVDFHISLHGELEVF